MNKQMMYTIRILLGGFLTFIGIRLLIQITDQRPTNTVPLGLFAGVVIIEDRDIGFSGEQPPQPP